MMRSMFSAVSGLKAHQLRMDVIGNNIANVNTVGFKGSRVTFQEVFSQTLRGASSPQAGRGGTNPQQVGLGINVASMDTFHIRGAVERTDYNTDLMINGEGFFMVSNTADNQNRYYTRAGSFALDESGNLVTPDGYKVLGYGADANGNINTNEITNLKVDRSTATPPVATTQVGFAGNLDSRIGADPMTTLVKVTDSKGETHDLELMFTSTDDGYTVGARYIPKEGEPSEDYFPVLNQTEPLVFDTKGRLQKTDTEDWIRTIIIAGDDFDLNPTPGDATLPNGAAALSIDLDFSKITSVADDSDASALEIDGYKQGTLEDFAIDANGVITGYFSNGQMQNLGQVVLASFRNPAGLEKIGGNMYRVTSNSGEPREGRPGEGGRGALNPGALEMSNVDLSREFTDMITTQRGFQANSRIITTSDEMLQEVVNMKR